MIGKHVSSKGTRTRLLQAAEALFVEHGYEAMSLRQITMQAGANIAAVNYHFGGKEALVRELLSHRLDRLNREREELLAECERTYGSPAINVSVVLSVLFVPALRLARDGAGGPAFMRFLGRVYSDPSPFIRDHLHEHYCKIFDRFFAAFARALPDVPRNELGVRLQLSLKAVAGMLASEHLDELIAAMCVGGDVSDSSLLSRLLTVVAPMLTTPFGCVEHAEATDRVMRIAEAAARAIDRSASFERGDRSTSGASQLRPAMAVRM
jgi:AcrR family transcriptional regulator